MKVLVVNAIIRKDDEFLIVKRKSSEKIHPGKWSFPGGMVEKDESLSEALKREIKEETNLTIKKIVKDISSYRYKRPNNDITEGRCFLVEVNNYHIKLDGDIEDFRWITIEEIDRYPHIEGMEEELLEALSKNL